jgi:hypothetical protein
VLALREIKDLPEIIIESHDEHFALARFRSLRVDVLRSEIGFFREVKEKNCERMMFAGREIPCATPLGLVLLKLHALPSLFRQFQHGKITLYEGDIQMLLEKYPQSHTAVMAGLQPFVSPSEWKELDRILADIEQRIERIRQNPFGPEEK